MDHLRRVWAPKCSEQCMARLLTTSLDREQQVGRRAPSRGSCKRRIDGPIRHNIPHMIIYVPCSHAIYLLREARFTTYTRARWIRDDMPNASGNRTTDIVDGWITHKKT